MVNYEIIKQRANELLFPQRDSKLNKYKRAYAWYRNDMDAIKEQIQESLYKSIVKSITKVKTKIKRTPYVNKIPKTLFRLCNLYKDTPERTILVDGKIDDVLTEKYNDLAARCSFDIMMIENHRLAVFYNTVIVGPYFENGELFLRTYLPFEYIVIPNDNDKSRMEVLLLLDRKEVEPNKFEESVIVWTKEKHYIITSDLNSKVVNTNVEKKNPYGVIPFIILRMKQDNYDFQGYGLDWMVEVCLSASVNLTYSNFLVPYNIGGILIAKNTSLKKTNKNPEPHQEVEINNQPVPMTEVEDSEVEIASDTVLSIKETLQGKDASLQYLSLQSDLSIVRNEVDWLTKNSLSDAGVDLNSIVLERGYTSGFGIVAESVGLMEIRKEHIPILSKFERDLFKMIKLLLVFEEAEDYYPENAELSIDYVEPQFPRTIEEIQKEREMKIKQNTASYLDFIKEDNVDITDNEVARKKIEENYRINQEFGSRFGSLVEEDTQTDENEIGITDEELQATGNEIDMPNDRQYSYWDCGDSVVVTALARFGIEPNPESLITDLGSTVDWGTEPESIKSVLESYGLTVELKEMTIENIKEYINNDTPVILDIQAWHFEDGREYDYSNEWNDGHYVTAYGYTETTIKLKDPSSLTNRELTYEELQKRWHDVDKEGNKLYNIGIAYHGLPVTYSSKKTEAIG
jgi:predicted double-glycine peptidase